MLTPVTETTPVFYDKNICAVPVESKLRSLLKLWLTVFVAQAGRASCLQIVHFPLELPQGRQPLPLVACHHLEARQNYGNKYNTFFCLHSFV